MQVRVPARYRSPAQQGGNLRVLGEIAEEEWCQHGVGIKSMPEVGLEVGHTNGGLCRALACCLPSGRRHAGINGMVSHSCEAWRMQQLKRQGENSGRELRSAQRSVESANLEATGSGDARVGAGPEKSLQEGSVQQGIAVGSAR